MKSVIAHRCSGVRASANEGIGVPLRPVVIVLKMSSRDRPSPEGPALREVRRAYRLAEVVHQRWSRRSVAAAEVAVALHAAGLLVELLPELDGLVRGGRRARELHGLGDTLGVREVGREGLDEVGEIRHFLSDRLGQAGIEV